MEVVATTCVREVVHPYRTQCHLLLWPVHPPLNDTVPLRYFSDRMNIDIADHQAHESCVKCSSCQVHPKENGAALQCAS